MAVARNLGRSLDGLTTANLDFDQKYRGLLNVLQRPGSEGIALTGHHELMIPLLHAAVAETSRRPACRGRALDDDRRLLPQPDRRHGDGHADAARYASGSGAILGVIKPHVSPTLDGVPWLDDRILLDPGGATRVLACGPCPGVYATSAPSWPSCSPTPSARRSWPGGRGLDVASAMPGEAAACS
ncbi:MAG: hypothetical protein WKF75_08835 [Singulisphaera sp.]